MRRAELSSPDGVLDITPFDIASLRVYTKVDLIAVVLSTLVVIKVSSPDNIRSFEVAADPEISTSSKEN